ncbi:MAG: hypothetical protein OXP28_03455 [Gammaproteobacteria bacterium]|nr:hypothetical protein [Gammaproteobacteria bacterium]
MHDGITFEQTGKRAVVLCTTPFEVTAKNMARMLGLPDYPFVIVDHPLGSCTVSEIRQRAASASEQAIGILTE